MRCCLVLPADTERSSHVTNLHYIAVLHGIKHEHASTAAVAMHNKRTASFTAILKHIVMARECFKAIKGGQAELPCIQTCCNEGLTSCSLLSRRSTSWPRGAENS